MLLGGGFIAAEFSHVAARAGAGVTVLEQMDRVLPQFDSDLVDLLVAKSRSLGIDLRLGTRVTAIEKNGSGFRVLAEAAGARSAIDADLVVHAAGRVPDIAALDLNAGGVRTRKAGFNSTNSCRAPQTRRSMPPAMQHQAGRR